MASQRAWEVTSVKAVIDPEGRIRPQTLVLEEKQWPVTDVGRQWKDEAGNHHVLVMIAGPRTCELSLDPTIPLWKVKVISGMLAV